MCVNQHLYSKSESLFEKRKETGNVVGFLFGGVIRAGKGELNTTAARGFEKGVAFGLSQLTSARGATKHHELQVV